MGVENSQMNVIFFIKVYLKFQFPKLVIIPIIKI